MERFCPICDYPFKDGDNIIAVMLSVYHQIESDVHYAIEQPKQCVEIVHRECYDFPGGQPPDDPDNYIMGDLNS